MPSDHGKVQHVRIEAQGIGFLTNITWRYLERYLQEETDMKIERSEPVAYYEGTATDLAAIQNVLDAKGFTVTSKKTKRGVIMTATPKPI
jgi:hypothetical protein